MAKKFHFGTLTHSPEVLDIISTCLGTGPNGQYTDKEVGKAAKMSTDANHVVCAADDEIEAFIDSIDDGGTENEGFTFGGVARGGRHLALIGAGQGTTTAASLLDLVVADAQPAIGTKLTASGKGPGEAGPDAGVAVVKTGTPTTHKWRIVHIYAGGDGFEGTLVCLEKAN